ncbi:MAG: LysR family transcriptional regulator [Archangium gephyra]|uniref:LysR family transcriptional regulator n=1 Tax=Archangium gephyra TaxID=48 RepID=A0A2W5VL41_9BACT|nr:MAG: LysR family transcriptional regulator [Archangium gephyra]
MSSLNYHHLQCFWLVARRGGLSAAAKELHVSASTIWAQVKAIEDRLGVRLLEKRGRRLELTPEGERVARVADELFALGQEVLAVARGDDHLKSPLRVGIVASLPRLIARRLVTPAMQQGFRLKVQHGSSVQLMGDLAAHRLDVVLTDETASAHAVRSIFEPVGSSPLALFCRADLHARLAPAFPRSLDGAPLLLPAAQSAQRTLLDDEFSRVGVRPLVVAEVDDSALLKTLGASGFGIVPAPELVAEEIAALYGLLELGRLEVGESYYAVTLERQRRHPAVEAMLKAAHAAPPRRA